MSRNMTRNFSTSSQSPFSGQTFRPNARGVKQANNFSKYVTKPFQRADFPTIFSNWSIWLGDILSQSPFSGQTFRHEEDCSFRAFSAKQGHKALSAGRLSDGLVRVEVKREGILRHKALSAGRLSDHVLIQKVCVVYIT